MTPEEIAQLKFDAARRAHETETAFGSAANAAAVSSGTETLKSLLLINGGSCIAVLTFIGTLATRNRPVSEFAVPLLAFAVGAGCSVAAGAAGYFTNLFIAGTSMYRKREYEEPFVRDTSRSINQHFWAEIFRWMSVAFAAGGIAGFTVGLYTAFRAFSHL